MGHPHPSLKLFFFKAPSRQISELYLLGLRFGAADFTKGSSSFAVDEVVVHLECF